MQIKTSLLIAAGLLLCSTGLRAAEEPSGALPQPKDSLTQTTFYEVPREERGITSLHNKFVPKGQWIVGTSVSYSTHANDTYKFLIIEGINSNGYTVKVNPLLAYAIADNMAIGARFTYSRTNLVVENAQLKVGETEININNYFSLKHTYSFAAIWRQYIPIGQNKRFAFFNEMQLSVGFSQAKFAANTPVKGTYETGTSVALGISPGLVAFATNNLAFELNIGVMGISYTHTKQVHNQVTVGERSASMMNFKVNIFSIGLGVAFYL